MTDDDVTIELEAAQTTIAAGVGRVTRAGERARSLVGRRVLVGPIDPCGECDICRRGGAAVCPRAVHRTELAAETTAAARWVTPLGDGLELLEPTAAAVAGDVALAYTLYARTGVAPKDPVVVVGDSPVARFLIEIAVAKGIAPVWLTAHDVGPRGARDRDAVTAAFAAQGFGTRPWRVIAAAPEAAATAAELAGPRATLTVLAPAVIASDVAAREVTVIGVAGAHPDLVVEAAALCVKRDVDLSAGVTAERHDPLRTHIQIFAR